jgi:cell division protein FtsB
MDTLIKTKNTITELNDRFFLILENFVPNYIRHLQDPTNTQLADEVLHVDTVNNRIQSDGFILKNSMESSIQTSQQEMATLNVKIESLKKENDKLTEQVKKLEKTSLTSVGLYDEEIDWYRLQVKTVLILLIGFVICIKVGMSLYPTSRELMMILGIVLILSIMEKTGMYLYEKIKDATSEMKPTL